MKKFCSLLLSLAILLVFLTAPTASPPGKNATHFTAQHDYTTQAIKVSDAKNYLKDTGSQAVAIAGSEIVLNVPRFEPDTYCYQELKTFSLPVDGKCNSPPFTNRLC